MREIKFRAWNKGDKCMCKVLGYDGSKGVLWAANPRRNDEVGQLIGNFEQLMQYTGFKDKNGKEIYESDLVKRTSMVPGGIDFLGKVVYEECEYWLENLNGAINLFSEVDELEVVGNIYENPELLEKD